MMQDPETFRREYRPSGLRIFSTLLATTFRTGATIVDENQVTIRAAFGSRTLPWPEVQSIEIRATHGVGVPRRRPRQLAVLYDNTGKRYLLPHLNDRTVPDLRHEVAALREVWILRRGASWTPEPEAAARIAYVRKHPMPAAFAALVAAVVAMVAALAVFVVVLASGGYSNADSFPSRVLSPAVLVAGIPGGTFVIALAVIGVRRRADRHGS